MSSRLQERTDSFKQQLPTAQRRHLIGHLETTISGYEELIDRQQKLLNVILQPQIKVRGAAVFPADVQQMSVIKDELLPEQQESSCSEFQDLKDLFKQQLLTAPREDLTGLFETTISRYQKEIDRQQKLLDVILQPEIKLRRAVVPADVQQLFVIKEEVPPQQQEWGPSLDQEDPEPPLIKEEQEEVWVTKFSLTPVPVKTEDEDEEKPQPSQLCQPQTEQMETEADGEDFGGPEPEEKLFSCSVCGKPFHRTSHLKRHMRMHPGEKPFSCSLCDKCFSQRGSLQLHVRTHTVEKPYSSNTYNKRFTLSCPLKRPKCGGESSQLHELSTSLDQEDPETPHIKEEEEEAWTSQEGKQLQELEEADITKFTFTPVSVKSEDDDDDEKPQSPQLHQTQTEQIETESDGEHCGGPEAVRNSDPDTHLQPVSEDSDDDDLKETRESQSGLNCIKNKGYDSCEKGFSCSECGKEFHNGRDLKVHMRFHTGEKPFSCQVCGKRFAHKATLQNHFRCHTGEKPFICSICGKGFAQKATLQNHFSCHTREKRFSCSFCNKCFSRSYILVSHMRIHTGEKPYSCSFCDKGFSQYHHFKIHTRTHTEEKPYSCSLCDKCFSCSELLQSHRRSHAGEKPFGCSVCGKTFVRQEILSRHMTCHTAEKPFHCTVCNTSFIDSESLIQHMRIHTRQTQFSCSICGEEFAWRRYLTKHMKVHETEDLYRCSVCDRGFTQRIQLDYHQCVGRSSSKLHQSPTKEKREPQTSSSAEYIETEADGEDCGGPELARDSHPDRHLQADTDDSVDSDFWKDTRERPSGLNSLENDQISENVNSCDSGKTVLESLEPKSDDSVDSDFWKDNRPYSCAECGQRFPQIHHLENHMRFHSEKEQGEKEAFVCSVCGQTYLYKSHLKMHMRSHTGEKPLPSLS